MINLSIILDRWLPKQNQSSSIDNNGLWRPLFTIGRGERKWIVVVPQPSNRFSFNNHDLTNFHILKTCDSQWS